MVLRCVVRMQSGRACERVTAVRGGQSRKERTCGDALVMGGTQAPDEPAAQRHQRHQDDHNDRCIAQALR